MLGRLEDLSAIGALALEHGRGVMEPMGEYVQLRVLPRHKLAVEPDPAVALIERKDAHAALPWCRNSLASRRAAVSPDRLSPRGGCLTPSDGAGICQRS